MKAFILTNYGPPEALQLQEVPKPVPADEQVLVKIHAAALNKADALLMRGKPFLMRMVFGGIAKPKIKVLGADIAGRIVAAGPGASRFQPGDAVFGDISNSGWGGFAEYAAVDESTLVKKPADMPFGEAAAVPLASVTALQAMRDAGKLQPGQKVLINGASGGVGTFAVQIAKALGAEVTAVCSTSKAAQAKALGADHVVNYTLADVTRQTERFDLILDIAAFRPPGDYKRILSPGGAYIFIGGSMGSAMKLILFGGVISRFAGRKYASMMARPNSRDLEFIRELMDAGKVRPVIDRKYSFEELPAAIRYLEEGHARGKIVISIS